VAPDVLKKNGFPQWVCPHLCRWLHLQARYDEDSNERNR